MSEILIGDILPTWDHLCPKRKILTGDNYYCGEVILPICCCFHPFLIYIDILIDLSFLCLLVVFYFSFPFQMCSSQGCYANSLPHSLIFCSHGLAASIRTYLADFKRWKLWALSKGFCNMPANTFHVAAYSQCLILKQTLLLLYLMQFTVSTGLSASPVGQRFLILSRFLSWLMRPKESWENRRQRKSLSQAKC